MKKALKIVGILAAVLVVLAIVLVVLANFLITPERVRALVIPRLETVLQRPVTLQGLEVSLFKGIALEGLVIEEKEGSDPFIAADRLVLRYQLWPLLFRRVIIDEAQLVGPRIRIERLEDGTFNFSDLLERPVAEETTAPPADDREGPPIDLLVSQIAITGGELLVIDHQVGGAQPYQLQMKGLELSARDISLQQSFPFQLQAMLNEGSLSAEGEVNPGTGQGSVRATASALDLAAFAPYFQEQFPGQVEKLLLALNIRIEGGQEALRSQGQITLEPIDLLLFRQGQEPLALRKASLVLDYVMSVDPTAANLDLEQSTITFNRLPLQLSGRVENYAEEPRIDVQAVLPPLDLATALAALPSGLVEGIAELRPAGSVSARARLAGAVAEPMTLLQSGEVSLSPVEATLGGARVALAGVLRMSGDALQSENLQMSMGENRADIDLRAENLFGEIIRVKSAVRSERFALDPLLQSSGAAPAATGQPGQGEQKPTQGEQQPTEPLDLPVTAEGSVAVGETVYKGLSVRDFDLQYRLEKNILTVQRLNGKVAQGTVGGTAMIDLGRAVPVYSSRLDLQGIQADPLISALWPKAAGTVFGTMNTSLTMEGKGTEAAVMRRNLTGQGDLLLNDGKLTGAGLLQGLADFLNLDELRELQFSQAKGSFTVREGKVRVNSDINGRTVRMQPQGTINLDGYALDIALNLRLAPELVQRANIGQAARLLTDEQGWTQVPLKVAGNVDKPRFSLEVAALKERAGEELKRKFQQELEKRLPRDQAPAEEGQPERPSGKQELEKTIRGLFGN